MNTQPSTNHDATAWRGDVEVINLQERYIIEADQQYRMGRKDGIVICIIGEFLAAAAVWMVYVFWPR